MGAPGIREEGVSLEGQGPGESGNSVHSVAAVVPCRPGRGRLLPVVSTELQGQFLLPRFGILAPGRAEPGRLGSAPCSAPSQPCDLGERVNF